jgi:hypothetical protein
VSAVVSVLIGLSCFVSSTKADERLWLNATINGTPAQLFFDTGAESYLLTADAAKRFGLKIANTPTTDRPGQQAWSGGMTETCLLNLEGTVFQTQFTVLNFSAWSNPDFDGVIGWCGLTGHIVRIHALGGMVTFPREVEEQLAGWTRLSVATNFCTLELAFPRTNGGKGIIRIDTGSPLGVMLPARTWQAWKKSHPHCPMTVNGIYGFADGYKVQEESWATNITLGPLVITDVPVGEAPASDESYFGTQYEGKLGLAALKRLDLIVDGKRGVAHLRTKTTPPVPYQHNRAGVAILPSASNTNVFTAVRVVEGSPAWEAGVRSGDTVLKFDGKVVSMGGKGSCLEGAPGTKLVLTLKRGSRTFDTTVTLRQILPPAPL